jgi:predicted RNA-binding protein
MCEFKIVNVEDGSQLLEDVVVLYHAADGGLILKDVLGMGEKVDSALIYDVNTLNQTCKIIKHPLVKPFIELLRTIIDKKDNEVLITRFKEQLDELI